MANNPAVRLREEILARLARLPAAPQRGIVVVGLMSGSADSSTVRSVAEFFRDVDAGCMSGAPQISAIVCGSMFVDSGGGLPKWEFPVFVTNPAALHPVNMSTLGELFAQNWTSIVWPRLPFTFRYELDSEPERAPGASVGADGETPAI